MDDRPIAVAPLGQIASLIALPLCAACGSSRQAGDPLCERCEAELEAIAPVREPGPAGVDLAVSAAPFEGVARGVVHGLKFGRRLSLAAVAAKAMLGALPANELVPGLAVVPVPAGPWRWRWRGFDPAEEIAIAAARQAALPLEQCLRRRGGRRQVGRRRSERLGDAPRVRAAAPVPREALLIDDVWTTGATLDACGRALRGAGSRKVIALTLARAL